ncbi:hypothetical protein VIRA109638_16425 [Vibrio rarus]
MSFSQLAIHFKARLGYVLDIYLKLNETAFLTYLKF